MSTKKTKKRKAMWETNNTWR